MKYIFVSRVSSEFTLGNSEDVCVHSARHTLLTFLRFANVFYLEDPVVFTKRNENYSSLPKGDTDTRRDKERMSVTTNRTSFYDVR